MKTSHQFATELLAGPDIQIVIPDSSKTPCEGACNDPVAIEVDGENSEGQTATMLLITGSIGKLNDERRGPAAQDQQ